MKIAPRLPGLHLALLGAAALLVMAGCTLPGSEGLGDVTPVPGGGEVAGEGGQPTPAPGTTPTQAAPTPIPASPTTAATLSDLETLGTQSAMTATAVASGATSGATPGAPTPSGPVVTSTLGGEIAPPADTPLETPVPAQAEACPPTHTVAQGENLYRIALRYGTTYQELAQANGITNPNQISAGLVLNIPNCGGAVESGGAAGGTTPPVTTATTHVVQPGENLFRIALQYNMTWTALAAANNITDPNLLVVGQVLQIPQ